MVESDCSNLISYLTGELSKPERERFKEHLDQCEACKEEYEVLQETWLAISRDRMEKETPAGWKEDVMAHVFSKEPTPTPSFFIVWIAAIKKSFTPLTSVLVSVLLICLIGLIWNDISSHKLSSGQEKIESTMRVKRTLTLQPVDQYAASGMVYLVRGGDKEKLIMTFKNLPKTKGNQVYQAWLLYDGQYQNCGTFRPNQKGTGVLTYRLPQKIQFDRIEITLEPHSGGKKPVGKTVMKT